MHRLLGLLGLVGAVTVGAAQVHASGFLLYEQNGRGVGSANAGEGAIAADASTIFWNPAGMTLLEGTNVAGSGNLVQTHAHFENEGSIITPALGGAPLRGPNSDSDEIGLLSSFYLSQQVTDRWRVGVGVGTPFGLRTQWDDGWVGRYHALKSDLRTINVNPSLAVRLTDWLSIGAGADAMWARATLTNAIDLGAVCGIFGAQAGLTPAACRALGFRPQRVDGAVKIRGHDWAFGYNAGILVHPTPFTRFGLTYRSRIDQELDGNAYFTIPRRARLLQATGALVNTPGSADLNLPDWTDLSAFHQITEHWAVLADIMWIHWDRFDTLVIRFANPRQPTTTIPENWDNTFRYALAFQYTPTPSWIFRVGTALDETPVPSPTFRTPRIPDSDRIWGSIGVGYVRDRLRLDFGYTHVFAIEGGARNADPNTGALLRGHFDGSADVFGIQASLGLF
ncbi:MAG TPA: outer membrane protein transport protein [Candidatus Binatia bacterium]|nr:outer membrane protein transport protein [Candidatus Binatia bacterium]